MAQASQNQMQEFVAVVDEFMQKFAKLSSPATRAEVYASGDQQLISDYESTLWKGNALKSSIETTVGAWNAAKRGWSSVTDKTSMYIGDAIDAIRNLFGGGPDTDGLGAIQIPAAAFVVGAIGASAALILSIDRIFIALEAGRIQRDSPGINREQAYEIAKGNVGLDVFGDVNRFAMIAGLAFIAYLIYGQKK
jgi:hypothetical protein